MLNDSFWGWNGTERKCIKEEEKKTRTQMINCRWDVEYNDDDDVDADKWDEEEADDGNQNNKILQSALKKHQCTASNITIVTMTRMFFFSFGSTSSTYSPSQNVHCGEQKRSEINIEEYIEKWKLQQNITLNNYYCSLFYVCRDENSKETPKRCEKYTDERMNHWIRYVFEIVFTFSTKWPLQITK